MAVAACWLSGYPLWVRFRLDPEAPYRIEFGRGSGRYGLNTVKVSEDGTAVLHRRKVVKTSEGWRRFWETATLPLTPDGQSQVLAAVTDTRVLGLGRAYSNPWVDDGTQWVLWVQQGDREVSVYCDNRFPRAVERFADRLDRILVESGVEAVAWHPVPEKDAGVHDRGLWDSMKR